MSGIWNGYSAAVAAGQTFTGTAVDLEATFSGDALTSTGTFTPEGTVAGNQQLTVSRRNNN